MAKKALTQATYATDNIQSQPNQVKGQAPTLKLSFDQTGIDQKTYNNTTLIPELGDETLGNSGSNTIGHNSASVTADNVGDGLEENRVRTEAVAIDVANKDAQNVKLTGNQTVAGVKTFSSAPKSSAAPSAADDVTRKDYVDGLDAQNVKITGNQSVAGVKTFTSSPVVPSPSGGTDAANKTYVDTLDGQNVKITGDQSVAGVKTFTSNPKSAPLPVADEDLANKQYVDSQAPLNVEDGSITNRKLADDVLSEPEYQAMAQTLDSIFDKPSYARGPILIEMEGLSLQNSVKNGDFSDTSIWTTTSATLSVSGNEATITPSGVNGRIQQPINFTEGDEWFFYCLVKATKSTVGLVVRDGTASPRGSYHTGGGSYEELYFTIDIDASEASNDFVQLWDTTGDGTAFYARSVHCVNKTALNIEHYDEKDMLTLVRSGYIDGLQGVENPSVESVGKNLFDKSTITYGFFLDGSTGLPSALADYCYSDYMPVKSGQSYGWGESNSRSYWYDGDKNYLGASAVQAFNVAPVGAKFARIDPLISVIDTVQYELSTVATAYEPHASGKRTHYTKLLRVPSAKDLLYRTYNDGKTWKLKRVGEKVLQASDFNLLVTSTTNIDYVRITKPSDAYMNNVASASRDTSLLDIYSEVVYVDDVANEFTYDSGVNSSHIFLVVPKGTYASLAEAQADLAGTVIHYELATPVVEAVAVEGLAEALDTIYIGSDTFQPPTTLNFCANADAEIEQLKKELNALGNGVVFRNNGGSPELSLDGGTTWLTITTS